jgi:ABC-2 type transport system permease protein
MGAISHTLKLGLERGLIEFKMIARDPQTLGWLLFMYGIFVTVLWFQRGTMIEGISLALFTLPGIIGMQIASRGFSDVASQLSFDREDGTLFRAKAIPRGMNAYFIARIVGTVCFTILYIALLLLIGVFIVPGLAAVISAGDLFLLLGLILLGLLASAPFGAIIGSLVKTSGSGWGLSLAPLALITAVSGIFYPITALAGWMQVVGQIFPIYWLGLGVRSVFAPEGAVALEIAGSWRTIETVLVLGAWAIVGMVIVPRVLRKMTRRTSGSEMEEARQRILRRGY